MRYREIIEGEAEKRARAERHREYARLHHTNGRRNLKRALELVGVDAQDIDPTLNDPDA